MKSRVPVIIAFLLLTLVAVPAFAASPYVSRRGGGRLPVRIFTLSVAGLSVGDAKFDTGYGLGLLGGFDFGTWRAEGEFA